MGIKDWLRFDESDTDLAAIIDKVAPLIDKVHRCPPPDMFSYNLIFYREEIGPFEADGCDVEWDPSLESLGAAGCFIPLTERPNSSRALISLAPTTKHPEITLIHEIGHLAHTTMLAACSLRRVERLRTALSQSDTFRNLMRVAFEKYREYRTLDAEKSPDNAETGMLMARSIYHASYPEWFSRIYVWMICRDTPLQKAVERMEFNAKAVDGKTSIYPSGEELNRLADLMRQVFVPGIGDAANWDKQN